MRVISCNSFTDNSSFSNNATIRSRVGSESARRNLRVELMLCCSTRCRQMQNDARMTPFYKLTVLIIVLFRMCKDEGGPFGRRHGVVSTSDRTPDNFI